MLQKEKGFLSSMPSKRSKKIRDKSFIRIGNVQLFTKSHSTSSYPNENPHQFCIRCMLLILMIRSPNESKLFSIFSHKKFTKLSFFYFPIFFTLHLKFAKLSPYFLVYSSPSIQFGRTSLTRVHEKLL